MNIKTKKKNNPVSLFFVIIILSVLMTGCPVEKKDSDSSGATSYSIGDTGPGGGIVFYITDGGAHGFEVAPVDQGTGSWSNIINDYANEISPLPADIGKGSSNTDTIIAQTGHTASAAKICRDYTGGGKTDWFLPSRDELNIVWNKIVDDGTGANSGTGNFSSNKYWCSSEYNANQANYQNFDNGGLGSNEKYISNNSVRAIRAF